MTTKQAITTIEKAARAAALFGADPAADYRKFAMLVHPDRVHDAALKPRAEQAFAKLSTLYAEVNGKATPPPATAIGRWAVTRPLDKGELCDLYLAESKDGEAVLKIARDPADNELLDREAAALRTLFKDPHGHKRYFPKLLDSLEASGRRANVISLAAKAHTLAYIRTRFPDGLDFRAVVWMGNRLLNALGIAHRNGVLHGAVLPEHVMYQPEDHGMALVDWCCSCDPAENQYVPLIVSARADFYPPEVRRKTAHCSTDIYMAAKCLMFAAGGNIPRRFRHVFEWMTLASPLARPEDAWFVQDRWAAAAELEYGKPSFVKLDMPVH